MSDSVTELIELVSKQRGVFESLYFRKYVVGIDQNLHSGNIIRNRVGKYITQHRV